MNFVIKNLINFYLDVLFCFGRYFISGDDRAYLLIDIPPFHHPPIGEKMLMTELPQLVLSVQSFPNIVVVIPDVQISQKI